VPGATIARFTPAVTKIGGADTGGDQQATTTIHVVQIVAVLGKVRWSVVGVGENRNGDGVHHDKSMAWSKVQRPPKRSWSQTRNETMDIWNTGYHFETHIKDVKNELRILSLLFAESLLIQQPSCRLPPPLLGIDVTTSYGILRRLSVWHTMVRDGQEKNKEEE
jgi:hypothetical protein